MPRTEPPASSYDRITSEHHSSLKGDTTDLSCGHTRGALWQHKMSVVARQDLCGVKRQGHHKGGRPPKAAASFVSCHHRGLVFPQQTSCVATAHRLSRHTRDPAYRLSATCYVQMFLCQLDAGGYVRGIHGGTLLQLSAFF